jgi:magnesium-transporting ATPase (P-type)
MAYAVQNPPPNPFRFRGPYRGPVSKYWVPRNFVQRLGLFMIGTIIVFGGVMMIVSTIFFKSELMAQLHSASAAFVMGWLLAFLFLSAGVAMSVLGIRLLQCAFRMSANAPGA